MSLTTLLRHRATIMRNVPTTSATRKVDAVWSELAADVPCLIQEGGTGDGAAGGRLGAAGVYLEYDAIAFFLPDQDLRPRGANDLGDQVIANGTTWLCRLVVDEAGMGNHQVAFLKRYPAPS